MKVSNSSYNLQNMAQIQQRTQMLQRSVGRSDGDGDGDRGSKRSESSEKLQQTSKMTSALATKLLEQFLLQRNSQQTLAKAQQNNKINTLNLNPVTFGKDKDGDNDAGAESSEITESSRTQNSMKLQDILKQYSNNINIMAQGVSLKA